MYSSISAMESIDYFCRRLVEIDFNYCGLIPTDFRTLFKVVLDNSYFQSEGMFYKQMHGLPLGDKTSGLLANYYMDSIERSLINTHSIQFYYRYVDDCLLITKSMEEAINIQNIFNSADRHICFAI
jgi:hypothetical protein